MTAAPAVAKCTREPDRSRSNSGSWAKSVRLRFALLSASSTTARGIRQPAVVAEHRSHSFAGLDAVGSCIFEADLFENTVDIRYDGLKVLIRERMVASTALSGPHGLHGFF